MSTIAAGTTTTTALVNTGDTTGALVFQTNGTTTAMTIDTSQNVGIGTSSPATKLDVSGAQTSNVVALGAGVNFDCSTGTYFTKTVAGSVTFTVSNVPASRAYAFTVNITFTSGSITWFANVYWPGNIAPTLSTGKNQIITFVTDNGGSTWHGIANANYNA